SGLLYAALVALIGVVGLWELMRTTLSIVLASVVIALALGLPIGILISGSERANRVARPIMDTMQTMPVFVYLIPALLLFGLGNPSAVIATVIYAIVPVIRLTSLGIRQVDHEVVEAARSFGSTRVQTLFKVQIPQAMPTIMTGVNQTLMMAMAMVVTCSMIGARGLGMEVLEAVQRTQIGRGLVAGACVVVLAVVLDRLTQGLAERDRKLEQAAGRSAKRE
ncbi:MAG: ABC transporter permease, partial [Candidatus Pararuminococcus gallinarum]